MEEKGKIYTARLNQTAVVFVWTVFVGQSCRAELPDLFEALLLVLAQDELG